MRPPCRQSFTFIRFRTIIAAVLIWKVRGKKYEGRGIVARDERYRVYAAAPNRCDKEPDESYHNYAVSCRVSEPVL